MNRIKILHPLLLIAAALCSCSQSDPLADDNVATGDDKIKFELAADWTKCITLDKIADVRDQQVFSYLTEKSSWSQTATNLKPYITDDIAQPFSLTQIGSNVWTYGDERWWPINESDKLSFISFAPVDEIAHSIVDGTPKFTYTLSPVVANNHDLVASAALNQSSSTNNGYVDLDLNHILSKISFEAKISGLIDRDATYQIEGITFFDLYSDAELKIADTGAMSWSIDNSAEPINVTSTEGYAIADLESDPVILSTTSQSIMREGHGIFLLPQTTAADGKKVAPTMKVRILETTKDGTQTLYETAAVTIPIVTGQDYVWKMGTHYKYSLDIDISDIANFETPMSVRSTIHPWSETDIDVQVHKNIYLYTSDNTIKVESSAKVADLTVCTNYEYNLRVPHHRVELDGKITASRGFLFCSDDTHGDATLLTDETFTRGGNTYYVYTPTLMIDVDGDAASIDEMEEAPYATRSNITTKDTAIYEYKNGYGNGTHTQINHVTTADIVYDSNEHFAYILDEVGTNKIYRQLYLDPANGGALTAFNYVNNDAGYHEISLSEFADQEIDGDKYVSFRIKIFDGYNINYYVSKSTRSEKELYVSPNFSEDDPYGVNKKGEDAVYKLILSINAARLGTEGFDDIIGVEMISNGGGMITQQLPVSVSVK